MADFERDDPTSIFYVAPKLDYVCAYDGCYDVVIGINNPSAYCELHTLPEDRRECMECGGESGGRWYCRACFAKNHAKCSTCYAENPAYT